MGEMEIVKEEINKVFAMKIAILGLVHLESMQWQHLC